MITSSTEDSLNPEEIDLTSYLMRSRIKAVNTAKPKDAHNAIKRNRFNVVKASACWVWMPKNRVVDHVSKNISASVTLKRLDYMDAQGRFFKSMHRLRGARVAQRERRIMRGAEKAERQKMKFSTARITAAGEKVNASNSQPNDKGFVDSGCSRHMTGNIAHLSDFKDFDAGYVTFGGGAYGGRITGKGTIKTDNLDFDDVYFVKELKFNLFSVSQMCDKKNYVLFTDSECLVLSPNFKLPDENQILLKIPSKINMYQF
ncbi:hypothetical protein Tco_0795044 [Tanacetum coccineum]